MKNGTLPQSNDLIGELEIEAADGIYIESSPEPDCPVRTLYEIYHAALVRYMARKLPYDLAENMAQEIWLILIRYEQEKRDVTNMPGLLWGTAKNKRATAVDKLTRERKKYPQSLDERGAETIAEVSRIETWLEEEEIPLHSDEQLEFAWYVPYFEDLFSPAERVFWMIEKSFNQKPHEIAKWTGKSTNVVYQTLYRARQKVLNYLQFETWRTALTNPAYLHARQSNIVTIPWFNTIPESLPTEEQIRIVFPPTDANVQHCLNHLLKESVYKSICEQTFIYDSIVLHLTSKSHAIRLNSRSKSWTLSLSHLIETPIKAPISLMTVSAHSRFSS